MTTGRGDRPILALVESNTTGTGRDFVAAARGRGLRPVLLTARPERYPWVAEDAVDVARADTRAAGAVAAAARDAADGARLAGLLTSSEYFVTVAAEAAAWLQLPGPDPAAVARCRDKRRQRRALQRAGVPVPDYAAAGSAWRAVEAATAIGFPVVVKPVDGTGSRGVRRCGDASAVADHAAALLAERHDERGAATIRSVLVERYVAGAEFSVETFGSEVVGITAKHLGPAPWFVECGHDFPATLGAADRDRLAAVAVAALDALGLGFGAAHTEIRSGPDGPVVIEVNPRLAGGRIPTLIRLATGLDLVGVAVDAAAGAGAPSALRSYRPAADGPDAGGAEAGGARADHGPGHASVRFLVPPRAGRVRCTGGVSAAALVPGVVDVAIAARAGHRVGGTGSFLDRVGHVIATGPTASAARTAADTALALLELAVDSAEEGGGDGDHTAPPAGSRPPTMVAELGVA